MVCLTNRGTCSWCAARQTCLSLVAVQSRLSVLLSFAYLVVDHDQCISWVGMQCSGGRTCMYGWWHSHGLCHDYALWDVLPYITHVTVHCGMQKSMLVGAWCPWASCAHTMMMMNGVDSNTIYNYLKRAKQPYPNFADAIRYRYVQLCQCAFMHNAFSSNIQIFAQDRFHSVSRKKTPRCAASIPGRTCACYPHFSGI